MLCMEPLFLGECVRRRGCYNWRRFRQELNMPIYEYICEDCQTHFEKIVLNKQQEIACPKCAGKKNAIQLSVFSSANGSSNGASTKSSGGFSGGGGSCCGGGCGCN